MIANGRWRRITEVVPATSRLRPLAIGYASEKTTSKHPNFSGFLIVALYFTVACCVLVSLAMRSGLARERIHFFSEYLTRSRCSSKVPTVFSCSTTYRQIARICRDLQTSLQSKSQNL